MSIRDFTKCPILAPPYDHQARRSTPPQAAENATEKIDGGGGKAITSIIINIGSVKVLRLGKENEAFARITASHVMVADDE